MLTQKEISLLYQIISEDNQTFEKISEKFYNNFKEENHSKVGTTLLFLLKDNILNIQQRIISYYILYEISKNEKMESNPYLSIILEKLQNSQNKNEQKFLVDFLYNKINYLDFTVKNYINESSKQLKINLLQVQMQWGQFYKEELAKKNIDLKTNDKIRPTIYDRKKSDIKNLDNHQNLNLINNSDDNNIKNEFNYNYFNPNYMSYFPNNNNFFNSEPIWILPQLAHNFIWEKKNNDEK